MPHRLPLAIGFVIFLLLTGTMYFASAPDSEHPEFWYDTTNLNPDLHPRLTAMFQTYGIKTEWISVSNPAGRLVDRPAYKIRLPAGFPMPDLAIEFQSTVDELSDLRVDGFENRREQSVHLHLNDGRSVLASYLFQTDNRIQLEAADIFILLRIPSGSDIPSIIQTRNLTATLLIDPVSMTDGQRFANLASSMAIDFGIYLNGKEAGLRLPARPTMNEYQQVNRKMAVLFPGASLFFTPKEQLKLPVKPSMNYQALPWLSHPNPINTAEDLRYVLSIKKDSRYLLLMATEELAAHSALPDYIRSLEKRGYRFRFIRDFNPADYQPVVKQSTASGSKRR